MNYSQTDIETEAQMRWVEARINVVREWKRANTGEEFPQDIDLDDLAPGTHRIGTQHPDRVYCDPYTRVRKEEKPERKRHFVQEQKARKEELTGLMGIHLISQKGRAVASIRRRYLGSFATVAEAAARYDEEALKAFGPDAKLNDPAAVERAEKMLDKMKRDGRLKQRAKPDRRWKDSIFTRRAKG